MSYIIQDSELYNLTSSMGLLWLFMGFLMVYYGFSMVFVWDNTGILMDIPSCHRTYLGKLQRLHYDLTVTSLEKMVNKGNHPHIWPTYSD